MKRRDGQNSPRLRKAREDWSQVFPLTGQLWLEWVADEQKIAATEEEKANVRNNNSSSISIAHSSYRFSSYLSAVSRTI